MKKYKFYDSPIRFTKYEYNRINFICNWAKIKPQAKISSQLFVKLIKDIEKIKKGYKK